MKKKRLLTLMALAVMAVGAWAQPYDNTTDYWIMDAQWSYVGIFPATDGSTSMTYVVSRGQAMKSGMQGTKSPTNEYVATAKTNNGGVFNDTNTSTGICKLTMTYTSKKGLAVEQAESLPLTVGSAKAATLCAPADLTIPSGVKAYKLKYEGGVLNATEVTKKIPANTPVLINAEPDDYSFAIDKTSTNVVTSTYEYMDGSTKKSREYIPDVTSTDNHLQGVLQMHYVPENSYVLQNGTSGIGFYKVNVTNYMIKTFRCYLTLPAASEARALTIVYDDENTTGVKNVKSTMAEGSNEIYNLSGQRVGKDYKGVVIKNGRKMIQK